MYKCVCWQAKEQEDCSRRLGSLAAMWEQGELSYPVKSAMARLATALHRRKCELAHDIHLALMFDHVAEVGHSIVVILFFLLVTVHPSKCMVV
jgi:hypothetical protein